MRHRKATRSIALPSSWSVITGQSRPGQGMCCTGSVKRPDRPPAASIKFFANL